MKTLAKFQTNYGTYSLSNTIGAGPAANFPSAILSRGYFRKKTIEVIPARKSDPEPFELLTREAAAEMAGGSIPDLQQVCLDLYDTFFSGNGPHSVLQFIPILKKLTAIDRPALERFLENPTTSHTLVKNELLKVVLIHWKPGNFSSIHGHAQGGCVFKVLQGKVEEKRYSPDESQRLMAVSTFQDQSMAYIDDDMAYHAVGNPFDTAAVSLHVYTPGRK